MRACLLLLVFSVLAFEGKVAVQEGVLVTGTLRLDVPEREEALQDVAVWLTPLDADVQRTVEDVRRKARFRVVQKDKRFRPDVLLIRVGATVDFPNADPFFHNVFSLYDGKRFDLGLYEAGSSRSVTFTRAGICYVFCNIHPEMSAAIVVVDTPFMALSTRSGALAIPDVPPGRYTLSLWHARYGPAEPGASPRTVTITEADRDVGMIRLVDTGKAISQHKNKYGRDYRPPQPPSPVYK
jgi:plastocyanin